MEKSSPSSCSAGDSLPDIALLETSPSIIRRESLPSLDLIDKRMWWFFRNCDSDEMIDTISFGEHWARIMQSRITEDTPLEQIWAEAWRAASDERTTERTMLRAVSVLARSWQYGDELRETLTDYQHSKGDSLDDFPY